MDIVLGVALTADSVRFVLAGGRYGDGELLGQDSFFVDRRGGVESASVVEHVVNAVLGTYAVATANANTVRTIAVTWTDAVAVEAGLLLDALDEVGLPGVVPVTGCDAVESVAASLCAQDGRGSAAVCLVEGSTAPTAFIACVHTADGIRRVRSRVVPAGDLGQLALSVRGASAEFGIGEMGVFAAGSAASVVGPLAAQLNSLLSTPVVIPRDAGFAFARGAALAAGRTIAGLPGLLELPAEADPGRGTVPPAPPVIFVPRTAKLLDIPVQDVEPRAVSGAHRKANSRSVRRLSAVVAGGAAVFISSVSMLLGGQLFGGVRDTAQASAHTGDLELSAASRQQLPVEPVTGPPAAAAAPASASPPPTPETPPQAVASAAPVAAPGPLTPIATAPAAAAANPLQLLAMLVGPQLAAINQAGHGAVPAVSDPALNAAALQVAQSVAGPAIASAQQPVDIPAVPPVSDQPVTLPPIADIVDSVRPDRQDDAQHFGDIPEPSTPYYQPPGG